MKTRIAFFTADWNYELVESILGGLEKYVNGHDGIQVFVFDCFGKDTGDARDEMEYSIFTLPDLDKFDGVIVVGSQVVYNGARQYLSKKILEAKIPAVSIDCPLAGCQWVGIDNRQAQYDIVNHLIQSHGTKTMLYITGLLDNGCPEGRDRLQGFLDICADQGIKESEYEVVEATWRTSDGYQIMKERIASGRPLPDAVVSGNDEMAIGAIEALHESGYSIPDDIIVTGFDNVTSSQLIWPTLSTVRRDYQSLTYFAVEVLISQIRRRAEIRGSDPDADVCPDHKERLSFPYDLVKAESCGCRVFSQREDYRPRYFAQTRFLKSFHAMQETMVMKLFGAENFATLMDALEETFGIFVCNNIWLCLKEGYFDALLLENETDVPNSFTGHMLLTACGNGDIQPDERHIYDRFPAEELLPDRWKEENDFLLFYPVYYNDTSIGYIAMSSMSETAKLNLHEILLSFIEIALENVRQKMLLRKLNGKLDDLYIRDGLTGLYNRFGYKRLAEVCFHNICKNEGSARILFVDMDDMKRINDQFGHEIGDEAIRHTAAVLRKLSGPESFLMRYGGDEFLLICSRKEKNLSDRIQQACEIQTQQYHLPYRLGVSIGEYSLSEGDAMTLDACVRMADAEMYRVKKNRRR